jgi:hypothetical protein
MDESESRASNARAQKAMHISGNTGIRTIHLTYLSEGNLRLCLLLQLKQM